MAVQTRAMKLRKQNAKKQKMADVADGQTWYHDYHSHQLGLEKALFLRDRKRLHAKPYSAANQSDFNVGRAAVANEHRQIAKAQDLINNAVVDLVLATHVFDSVGS